MRLAAEDIARSLRGSWRLMSEGAEALPDLDLSREGFWRSFLALALMAPATIALLAATRLFAGLPNTGDSFLSTFGTNSYSFAVNYQPNAIALTFTPVPEPATWALLGSGLLLTLLHRRRRRS